MLCLNSPIIHKQVAVLNNNRVFLAVSACCLTKAVFGVVHVGPDALVPHCEADLLYNGGRAKVAELADAPDLGTK